MVMQAVDCIAMARGIASAIQGGMATHNRDSDCTVGQDGMCLDCGVYHGAPCLGCGGRGFHAQDCPEMADRPCPVCGAVGPTVRYYGHRICPECAALPVRLRAAPCRLTAERGDKRTMTATLCMADPRLKRAMTWADIEADRIARGLHIAPIPLVVPALSPPLPKAARKAKSKVDPFAAFLATHGFDARSTENDKPHFEPASKGAMASKAQAQKERTSRMTACMCRLCALALRPPMTFGEARLFGVEEGISRIARHNQSIDAMTWETKGRPLTLEAALAAGDCAFGPMREGDCELPAPSNHYY